MQKDALLRVGSRELPPGVKARLQTFSVWLAALTVLGWAAAALYQFAARPSTPLNWPLLPYTIRFSDLTDYSYKIRHLSEGAAALAHGLPLFVYPAPALFVYWFFIRVFSQPALAYLAFSLAVWIAFFALSVRQVRAAGFTSSTVTIALIFTAVLCYPFLFLIDRGNIEIVVVLFLALSVLCFTKKAFWQAAVFLGLAGCIKPFPLLFLYLFLKEKRFREIGLCIGVVAIGNLAALLWLGPTIGEGLAVMRIGAESFLHDYVLQYQSNLGICSACVGFDHSFFSVVKQVMQLIMGWFAPALAQDALLAAYRTYSFLAITLVVFCAYVFWRKPLINRIIALVVLMLTVPPVSHEYTLISVYIILALIVARLLHDGDFHNSNVFLISLAILLSPLPYFLVRNHWFAGQVKAFVLATLLISVSRVNLPSALFGEVPQRIETAD